MKLSTKGRYGIRILLDVALHKDESPISLREIAERQDITQYYLERIAAALVREGFLSSMRGPSGGVSLARNPEDIRVREVLEAMEGSLAPVYCVDDPSTCSRADDCVTCGIWAEVKEAMVGVLESVTLKDLVERQLEKTISK